MLVNFKQFDPENLSDINDFDFSTLGKNYKYFDWSADIYDNLSESSIEDIDWTQVDYKKALTSDSFSLDHVDWDEVNNAANAKAKSNVYKAINWETEPISSDVAGKLDF